MSPARWLIGASSFMIFAASSGVYVISKTWNMRERHVIICREQLLIFVLHRSVIFAVWNLWIGLTDGLLSVSISTPLSIYFTYNVWKDYRKHRDHDEDCVYGPKRRRQGSGVRIRIWWRPKVLVAPA